MNKQMNAWQFSRKTRTGALVLLALLLIFIVLWRLLPSLVSPQPAADDKALQSAWSSFKAKHINTLPDKAEKGYAWSGRGNDRDFQNEDKTAATTQPRPFDPNTATEEELIAVGFSPRTAKTMIKYRSKGGKFRKKEDLQKLYTLSAEDYERLAPYARFGNEPATTGQATAFEVTPYKNNAPQKLRTLELNAADADALLSMPGIGPAFSKRIINFRTALGGFVSVEQLKEVYGFPDSTYQQLKDRFTINSNGVKRLNINEAGEQELGKHPYIGRKLAADIIKKRNALGNYSQLEQLKQIPLINDEKYRKIAPYLSTH